MVSLRNQSWVVNVDRATMSVIWVLGEDGDFELVEGKWFNAQHASAWLADQVMIYDNGNEKTPPRSRIATYMLDTSNVTARETSSRSATPARSGGSSRFAGRSSTARPVFAS